MAVRSFCLNKRRASLHLIARGQGPVQFGMKGRVVGAKDQSQVVNKLRESALSLFRVCLEKKIL